MQCDACVFHDQGRRGEGHGRVPERGQLVLDGWYAVEGSRSQALFYPSVCITFHIMRTDGRCELIFERHEHVLRSRQPEGV